MTADRNFVAQGLYDQQLAWWRSKFPAESFCIISNEYLLEHTAQVSTTCRCVPCMKSATLQAVNRILRFIGVPELDDMSESMSQSISRLKHHSSNDTASVCVAIRCCSPFAGCEIWQHCL